MGAKASIELYLDVLRLKVLKKVLDFQSVPWYHIDTKKGEIKVVYRVYRRMMRKFARFILGFDNCPTSCRKNYRRIAINLVGATLLCIITIALFGALAINCWKVGWSFVWFSLGVASRIRCLYQSSKSNTGWILLECELYNLYWKSTPWAVPRGAFFCGIFRRVTSKCKKIFDWLLVIFAL